MSVCALGGTGMEKRDSKRERKGGPPRPSSYSEPGRVTKGQTKKGERPLARFSPDPSPSQSAEAFFFLLLFQILDWWFPFQRSAV